MSNTAMCPYCWSIYVVDSSNSSRQETNFSFSIPNFYWARWFQTLSSITICTNEICRKHVFNLDLRSYMDTTWGSRTLAKINWWQLLPESLAKQFPAGIIPDPIIEDYDEACKIASLSPKAAATLLRRCLQWMIRDFHKITKSRLIDEINELKIVLHDQDVIDAIDTLRSTWNIGAHMEKDINLIIDIDAWEVEQLKWLIEFLMEEWYIKRHNTSQRLQGLKALGISKQKQKNP